MTTPSHPTAISKDEAFNRCREVISGLIKSGIQPAELSFLLAFLATEIALLPGQDSTHGLGVLLRAVSEVCRTQGLSASPDSSQAVIELSGMLGAPEGVVLH